MNYFGERLKAARLRLAAPLMGTNPGTLHHYESGEFAPPRSPRVLLRMINGLKVSRVRSLTILRAAYDYHRTKLDADFAEVRKKL